MMKKSTLFLLLSWNATSCSFPVETKSFAKYKVSDTAIIELVYVGAGATTENVVEVRKISDNKTIVLEKIIGLDDSRKIDFAKINDSVLKITFTDTTYFKGDSVDIVINLNSKAVIFSKRRDALY